MAECPPQLAALLRAEGIDPRGLYAPPPRRFVWCGAPSLLHAACAHAAPVSWAPSFYSLPRDTALVDAASPARGSKDEVAGPSVASLAAQGLVLGVEPAAHLAVASLGLRPDAHVLDLCCAPGTKLVLIWKELERLSARVHGTCPGIAADGGAARGGRRRRGIGSEGRFVAGTITAVDVSRQRLGAAVALAKRFGVGRLRVFCCDGAAFDERPRVPAAPGPEAAGGAEGLAPPRALYSSTVYRRMASSAHPYYDAVLVDAQCTHDGSVKHVLKHLGAPPSFWDALFAPAALDAVEQLQRALLRTALRLARPAGGIVVYATCSLLARQNEAVVAHVLDGAGGGARIAEPAACAPHEWHVPVRAPSGRVLGRAVRVPASPDTGGSLFVCRIERL